MKDDRRHNGNVFYAVILSFVIIISSRPMAIISDSQIKISNSDLLISADVVLSDMNQKNSLLLIDIRPAAQFEKLRIPGALSIPLFAIKTKTYLKKHTLVLAGPGYGYNQIASECRLLRKSGFNVWVMAGGLHAWHQKGGALDGDVDARRSLNRIPPMHFYEAQRDQDWLILTIVTDKKQKQAAVFPESISMPYTKDAAIFATALEQVLHQQRMQDKPFTPILIADERGEHYDGLERIIRDTALKEAFFLEGGLDAYGIFLSAMEKGLNIRKKSDCYRDCR